LAITLIAGEIVPATAADDGTTVPGTRLVWHPVRPDRSDDAGANTAVQTPAEKNCDAQSAKSQNDAADADHPCKSGKCDVAVKKDHAVAPAQYTNDGTVDYQSVLKNKVRLAAGQSSAAASGSQGSNKSSNLALTDPFGDNMPSVRSHRIAMAPSDDVDTLPGPTQQNTASPMRIEQTGQDPAELTPPEPLRSGLPKRTVKTYQQAPPAASTPAPTQAPELLPGGEMYPKLPLRDPEAACKEEYDHIKAVTLNKLSIDIVPAGNQAKGDQVPFECGLSTDEFTGRCWPRTTYTWKASALCHKPLYFEDDGLERYGHSWGPYGLEDAQSFVHFFGDLVLLPYNVGVQTPCECDYALGYYRPGDCAPWICDPFPLSCRGVMTGAVGYCAFAALFP